MSDEKTLIVMRGLPSTGKSTRAKELLELLIVPEAAPEPGKGIFSTDEFFYIKVKPDKPKEYSFDRGYLGAAHKWNLLRVQDAINWSWPLVIIDNTNTTAKEFCCGYAKYGFWQGYKICIEEPTSERWMEIRQLLTDKRANKKALKEWAAKLAEGSRETHGVPAYAIEKMMWRWECDLDPENVVRICEEQHTTSLQTRC